MTIHLELIPILSLAVAIYLIVVGVIGLVQ